MPLTVTVKGSDDQPVPNAAFTISRGDSLPRSSVSGADDTATFNLRQDVAENKDNGETKSLS
ncbi:hypothetical protein DQ806_15990 [Salmonella enterica subsp. enterica serovar Okatie]|nr:hypothetical protein [Salmonella enterica subsp. enterica serovar Okatie]